MDELKAAPKRQPPRVTVLMPVFNGEAHVRDAIDSILNQTFRDFELLIINDGSTDQTASIVASYDDARIRSVRHSKNRQLIATLNHGLDLARGEYVARMDADDISLPTRLERQVSFLDSHPEVGMCGTWAKIIGRRSKGSMRPVTKHEAIRCRLLFGNAFVHSSVLMRRRLFQAHGLRYDPAYPHAEDLQLWQRAAEAFSVSNLPEVLVHYRIAPEGICQTHHLSQQETLRVIDTEALARFGISLDADELALFRRLDDWAIELEAGVLDRIEALILKLQRRNAEIGHFPALPFDALLGQLWFRACHRSAAKGLWTWGRYPAAPFATSLSNRLQHRLIILVRYLLQH